MVKIGNGLNDRCCLPNWDPRNRLAGDLAVEPAKEDRISDRIDRSDLLDHDDTKEPSMGNVYFNALLYGQLDHWNDRILS